MTLFPLNIDDRKTITLFIRIALGDWCLSLPVFCLIMLNDNRFSNQLDDSRNKMDEIDRICLCGRQEHD